MKLNYLFTRPLFNSLLLTFIVLICVSKANCIPLSKYQENLQQAITALDTLTQQDENETETQYSERIAKTTRAIRAAVPENSMIEVGDQIYSVQNYWLHNELGHLETANPGRRPILIHQLIDQLRALTERIEEVRRQPQVDSTNAREKLEAILHRPEYQSERKGSGVLARLLRDFFRWLESLFPKRSPMQPERANSITTILSYAVLAVCIIVIAYVLRLLLRRFVRDQKTKRKEKPQAVVVMGERIAPEKSSRDLLSEAEQLAREGKLRAAIRKAYIALLLELADRHVLSLAQNKTNRDYLRSVQHVPTLYSNLSGVTDSFERHWYGASQATQEDWQQFRSAYFATLKGEI